MDSQKISPHFAVFSQWIEREGPSVQEVYQESLRTLWGLADGEHNDFEASKQAADHLLVLARSSGIPEIVTDFSRVAEEVALTAQNVGVPYGS